MLKTKPLLIASSLLIGGVGLLEWAATTPAPGSHAWVPL